MILAVLFKPCSILSVTKRQTNKLRGLLESGESIHFFRRCTTMREYFERFLASS